MQASVQKVLGNWCAADSGRQIIIRLSLLFLHMQVMIKISVFLIGKEEITWSVCNQRSA